MFYAIAALAGLLLIAAENRLGMFDHLTVSESAVEVSGVQFSIDGIDPMWASSPPLWLQGARLGRTVIAARDRRRGDRVNLSQRVN